MHYTRLIADTCLFKTEYLGLYETDDKDYMYVHEELAANGTKVAILPYFWDNDRQELYIMGVVERCTPKSSTPQLCSITGKCEQEDLNNLGDAALRELLEETGLIATKDDLIYLGDVYPSKSMDTTIECFAINVKNLSKTDALGDGTEREEEAYSKWITLEDAATCQDPLMSSMVFKFLTYTGSI